MLVKKLAPTADVLGVKLSAWSSGEQAFHHCGACVQRRGPIRPPLCWAAHGWQVKVVSRVALPCRPCRAHLSPSSLVGTGIRVLRPLRLARRSRSLSLRMRARRSSDDGPRPGMRDDPNSSPWDWRGPPSRDWRGPTPRRDWREPQMDEEDFRELQDPVSRGVRRARDAWRSAAPSERYTTVAVMALAAAGGAAVLGAALQLAAFAAIFVFPLLLFPLFVVIASFGAVALAMFTVAGASVMFIGAPFLLGGAFLVKAIAPIAALAFLALKVRKVVDAKPAEVKLVDDTDMDEGMNVPYESLSEFDRKLEYRERATRAGASPSSSLAQWSVQDCVDDLYAQGLSPFVVIFTRERIDGHVLSIMSDTEIEYELCQGMTLGDRKRFVAWARRFKSLI